MNARTEYQTIEHGGHPAFVLVPWEDYERIRPFLEAEKARSTGIPQSVVEAYILQDVPLIRAWREELGLTQEELASRMGISQAAVAKFEQPTAHPRTATLKKIASALGITVDQLRI